MGQVTMTMLQYCEQQKSEHNKSLFNYIFWYEHFQFSTWNLILRMIVRMEVKRPFFSWQYVDCQEVKTTAQHGYIFSY